MNRFQVGGTYFKEHYPTTWIEIDTGPVLLHDGVYQWLYENTTNYWHREITCKKIYFKSEEDATLYKLTWI